MKDQRMIVSIKLNTTIATMTIKFGCLVSTAKDFLDLGSDALDSRLGLSGPGSVVVGADVGEGLVASCSTTSSPISNLQVPLGGEGSLPVMLAKPLNSHPFML